MPLDGPAFSHGVVPPIEGASDAPVVLVLHGLFIAFVLLGGLAVARFPRLVWLHLPAVAWGAWVSGAGWICPLTPLENRLRRAAGEAGYPGGFVEHYLVGLIYPEGLTRGLQLFFGLDLPAAPERKPRVRPSVT